VLLGVPRSTLYYRSVPVRESMLQFMARLDALYLDDPCSGSRRMVAYLAGEGIPISRNRVRTLMRRMGLRAIYQKPRTTFPGDPSDRFPCLVDLKEITALDQVCATDITYITLHKGFLYLVAIMDLHSRHVLSWKQSNSLDTEFCLEALEMGLSSGPNPQIFHSDHVCQFTSIDFVARLQVRRSISAVQDENAATTTSWSKGCGGHSSTRRSIYRLTAMVGRPKSALPASCGGTAI
jgi:putative transposase